MNPKLMVIVYCLTETGVYLGSKITKIGAGCLNSVGGKVDGVETLISAVIREAYEEWGIKIDPLDLKQMALLHISREGRGHEIDLVVYTTKKWTGEFRATPEIAAPELYQFDKVPYEQLMPADKDWLPAIFFGQLVEVSFLYDESRTTVIGPVEVRRVEAFE